MVPPGSDPLVIDFAKFGGADVFSGSDPNESSGGAEVFPAVIQFWLWSCRGPSRQ